MQVFQIRFCKKMIAIEMIVTFCICACVFDPDCYEKDMNFIENTRIGVMCCPDGSYLFEGQRITARAQKCTICQPVAKVEKEVANESWKVKGIEDSIKGFGVTCAMILICLIVTICRVLRGITCDRNGGS